MFELGKTFFRQNPGKWINIEMNEVLEEGRHAKHSFNEVAADGHMQRPAQEIKEDLKKPQGHERKEKKMLGPCKALKKLEAYD